MGTNSNGAGTYIHSVDFERLVGEVATGIWNQLIEKPAFYTLKVNDYVHVFDAVSEALAKHRQDQRLEARSGRSTDIWREIVTRKLWPNG